MAVGSEEADVNDLRDGWDLLVDIDSKYFEVAKYAAISIIDSLESHGIKNYRAKFSGNKGFHIIVPWEAFPKEINGQETAKMFPGIPRIIVGYLMDNCKDKLEKYLKGDGELWNSLKGSANIGVRCENCKNIANSYYLITLTCSSCSTKQQLRRGITDVESSDKDSSFINGKQRKCVQCSSLISKSSKEKVYFCEESECKRINLNSKDSPGAFSNEALPDIYEQLGLDVILVSPRHLFRAPYSLHEKTSLSSAVVDKSEIIGFKHADADPMRVIPKPFLPVAFPDEAKRLVVDSLDWFAKNKKADEGSSKTPSLYNGGKKEFKEVVIDRSKLVYAPVIEEILKGLGDGRKRGLFILINYFKSLNFSEEEVVKLVNDWNKKNKKPLRDGYVSSQVSWSYKQKKLLPPNYDKPHYKGIGITPTSDELKSKNPVSYTIRKMFSNSRGKDYK